MNKIGLYILLALVVVLCVVFWNMGKKEASRYYAGKIDSLNTAWNEVIGSLNKMILTIPPSNNAPESIWVKAPPVVKIDTLIIDTTRIFEPDSIIASKYPKAIWIVSYNAIIGKLEGTTYDGQGFVKSGVGSFFLKGDKDIEFMSSPFSPEGIKTPKSNPAILGQLCLVVNTTPEFGYIDSIRQFNRWTTYVGIYPKLDFRRMFELGVIAGVKTKNYSVEPFVSVNFSVKLAGK